MRIHYCVSFLVVVFIRSVGSFFSIQFHFQVCLHLVIFVQSIINIGGVTYSRLNFVLNVAWM